MAINDNGTVVGYAYNNLGVRHACLWVPVGFNFKIYDLGTDNPGFDSEARGISNSGQVVGSQIYAGTSHGVTWINGRFFDLNTRANISGNTGLISTANAVNDWGHITGGWKQNAQSSTTQAYYLWANNGGN